MRWSQKQCVVLDMDGTVYLGDNPIVGAVQFIQRHWHDLDFYFLTNNTSKSITTYVGKLQKMGIEARPEILVSPVFPLINFLRNQGIKRVYLVGNTDFSRELHEFMPELVETETQCQAVILAYDTELTYEKLKISALLLQNPEILFLATHPDLVCPSPKGPLPDVGSFLSLYATATKRKPEHIFGKPDPNILQPLLARYPREAMIMVGDRLSTDKKLAENAGIDFALVLSGEATLAQAKNEPIQPTVILDDLGCAEKNW